MNVSKLKPLTNDMLEELGLEWHTDLDNSDYITNEVVEITQAEADAFYDADIKSNTKTNCISYGLNQKSTITISSIQEDKAILSIQRNIKNLEQKTIEMGEMEIDIKQFKPGQIENILAIFTIYLIYNKKRNEK